MNAFDLSQTPTLVRLCFRAPPERMAEFEAQYSAQVAPFLEGYELAASSETGRPVREGVFCRLFEVASPSEAARVREALGEDSAWQEVLKDLGAAFGTDETGGPVPYSFELYTGPAGSGRSVPAGPGTGQWHAYDVGDGLADGEVRAICQDREGYLWFATRSGVSRFDGRTFRTLTTDDGLVHNAVFSMIQDREGRFWFGTEDGVSRYDPSAGSEQAWTMFKTGDGFGHNTVLSILQDRDGALWFGTAGGGVSRFDGREWVTFTTRDEQSCPWASRW